MNKLSNIALFSFFTLLSTSAYASCHCVVKNNGRYFYEAKVDNIQACKTQTQQQALRQFKDNYLCSQMKVSFSLSCQPAASNELNMDSYSLSCSDLEKMHSAESIMDSVMYSTKFTSFKSIDPNKLIKNENCLQDKEHTSKLVESFDIPQEQPKLRIKIHNEQELKELLASVNPQFKNSLPGDVLDRVNDMSLSIFLRNDNSINDIGQGGNSDDVGDTHGLKLLFSKALDGDGYILDINYESSLYTNFVSPDNKAYTKDADGNYHISQYFIEENIGEIILRKQKSGDAYYWSIGGGIHQLNKSDPSGSLGFMSALGSQTVFHDGLNKISTGSARIYNNVAQDGSESSASVVASAGKRFTIEQSESMRIFLEAQANAKVTGVKDASYIGAKVAPYLDYQITDKTAARIGAGIETRVYADKKDITAAFVEVAIGNENLEAAFKYELSANDSPDYQNALPSKLYGQEFRDSFAPAQESTWTIMLRGKY